VAKSIEVKNNLKIPQAYKDNHGYLQSKADLDLEIATYNNRGSVCYKNPAKSGVTRATHINHSMSMKFMHIFDGRVSSRTPSALP
jgi:hypothetical protein